MSNVQQRRELSKHGRLRIVWVAGNMSAGTYRTKLTRRDYSRVNVVEVCQVFVDLEKTFSLRQSSILMLGVVRVYEQQTNFLYSVFRKYFNRLKISAERETLSSTQRAGAITIPDRLDQTFDVPETVSDFSLCTEGKFFSVDYTDQVSSGTSQVANTSQLDFSLHVADPKDITIEDCIPPSLNSTFIEEDDNFGDPEVPTLGLVMVHNGTVTPVARSSQLQCEGSQDRSTASTPCLSPMACDQEMLFDPESGDMRPHSERAQSHTSTPHSTPYHTPLARRHDNSTPIASFVTPYRDRPAQQQQQFDTRKSKRRLMFDVKTVLSNNTLKKNLKTGQTTLKNRPPVKKSQSAKELLSLPVEPAIARNSMLLDLYKKNITEQASDRHTEFEFILEPFLSPTANNNNSNNNNNSIEEAIQAQSMSASDVEVLRGGSRLSNYYDSSNNATLDQAPVISDVSGDAASMNDTSSYTKRQPSLSSTNNRPNHGGSLPIILEGLSLIEDVTGFEGDPGILMPPELDDSGKHSLFPDAAATPVLREATVTLSRQIVEKMDNREEMDFSELLPSKGQCSRLTAARTFSQTLELLSKGVIRAEQQEPYGEIRLYKGPNY